METPTAPIPKALAKTQKSPDTNQGRLEDANYRSPAREKAETDKKIEAVLSWLQQSAPREESIIKSLQSVQHERREVGTFQMLRELWEGTPSDCKAALIGEFLFNPDALKGRYYQERHFQSNLKKHWKKQRGTID